MKQSTDLRHTIDATTQNGDFMRIKICLNDDCHNGHQDFAITADVWEAGKPKTDRYFIMGGCCHEEILKAIPDLKLFVDLHLCDYLGAPMYAAGNGFYRLKEKPETAKSYLRLTDNEFEIAKTAEDELHLSYLLESLGVVARWKNEAKKAIELLEQLTEAEFVNNSTKRQYTPLTAEQIATLEYKLKTGYYSDERKQARQNAKTQAEKAKQLQELNDEKDKAIGKIMADYNIRLAVLTFGLPINNLIYYNHTNEAVFNWNTSSYNKAIEFSDYEAFREWLHTAVNGVAPIENLPSGIQFKFGK